MLLPRFDFYLLLKFKVALGGGLLGGGIHFIFFFFECLLSNNLKIRKESPNSSLEEKEKA